MNFQSSSLIINTSWLSFEAISNYIKWHQPISLAAEAEEKITNCYRFLVQHLQHSNELIYGVNTGFGFLQNVKINSQQIEELQYNLLQSHACGVGNEVPKEIIRLMLMLKIKSLSYGNSGVQLSTVNRLAEMHNHNILPVVYTQGSLGASGDLAPLSHLCLPLIGLGEVYRNNQIQPTAEAWKQLGWQPVTLSSKEGLALINGTQFMTAYGLYCLYKAYHLLHISTLICALSFDAFDCMVEPLHPSLHSLRPHKGQSSVAAALLSYLKGSEIAFQKKEQVQDPYSFRCAPQVHGATQDVIEYALQVFITEANSVTDNPIIFPEENLILSGGNFHGQPLALQLDFLSIAMSELANISERRIYQLISGQRGLPLFLVKNAGLNSGFMIPQYTAAALVSENKQLCTPASVDSISSSNNQEDHVSMGANAATKCLRVIENVEKVLAIELLSAAQALDFRRPLHSSSSIEKFFAAFRKLIPFNTQDRVLHNDIVQAIQFIRNWQ